MATKTRVHTPGHVPCWWQREPQRPCSQKTMVVYLGLRGSSLWDWPLLHLSQSFLGAKAASWIEFFKSI